MQVLLIERDIFRTAGGGQTVYRRLIELNPAIEFFYFAEYEKSSDARPSNAHPIEILPYDQIKETIPELIDLSIPRFISKDLARIDHYLSTVRGRRFDVIDFPDYVTTGYLVRPALDYFGIQAKKIVIALHGSVSTTVGLDWQDGDFVDVPWNLKEQWQFAAADIRYAISQGYADEWNALAPFPVEVMDPLLFVDHELDAAALAGMDKGPVTLSFIGRPERRKGPDIFLDILSGLDPSLGAEGLIIGPDVPSGKGPSTRRALLEEAQKKGLKLTLVPEMSPAALKAHYHQRTIAVLPSRYDSFNLVALEAILQGCPLAVGKGAKVVSYLRERFPSLPFIEIDVDNPKAAIAEIELVLRDFDRYQADLKNALREIDFTPRGKTLADIYGGMSCRNAHIDTMTSEWYQTAHAGTPAEVFPPNTIGSVYRELWQAPEEREEQLLSKLQACWQITGSVKIDRVRLWREMARLERMRGNDLLWATYSVRIMRLLGNDHFGVLPDLCQVLTSHQYSIEAQALRALYGSPDERFILGSSLLNQRLEQNRENSRFEHAIFDDRRGNTNPKVSVIVSMYGAEAKLAFFLKELSKQTLLRAGQIEIVLVDSGSPTNEYEVFKNDPNNLPILYVRSHARETIQCAWNRGISEARGQYLAFLGVDETVTPEAFEVLAAELDRDPGLDWAIGTSVVMNVDTQGQFVSELNRYDRSGYDQDLVYLETCYLSWVGALYRRSIHDRFGYYDPSFRAAGDTEFKCRVLPHIRSKALPQILGIFLNYPEERTTESPMAEIEDIRAWYLHRSFAGVEYAFGKRGADEIAQQVRNTLSYRKSYLNELSTDFDYAAELLRYLERRAPAHPMLGVLPGVLNLKSAIIGHEYVRNLSLAAFQRSSEAIGQAAGAADAEHRKILGVETLPYRIFNDNRFEQHYWPWKNQGAAFFNRVDRRYRWR